MYKLKNIRIKIELLIEQIENSDNLDKDKLKSELKTIQTPYRKGLEKYYVEKTKCWREKTNWKWIKFKRKNNIRTM